MKANSIKEHARMSKRRASSASRAAGILCGLAFTLVGMLSGCAGLDRPEHKTIVSFGDSLSDLGTYAPRAAALGGGKFTVNPGPIWVEIVAARYGSSIGPYRTAGWGYPIVALGGTAYGEGGSRVAQQPGSNNTDADKGPGSGQTTLPVREQISAHLASHGGRFGADELVLVWAGANDVFRHALFAPPASAAEGEALVRAAADDLVNEIRRIKEAHAQRVLVLALDDYGEVPVARRVKPDKAALLSRYSHAFNDELRARLASADAVLVETDRLFADARTHPAHYGLINARDPACKVDDLPARSVTFCTRQSLVVAEAQRTYLYADSVHPTPAGHQLVAGEVLRALGVGPTDTRQ